MPKHQDRPRPAMIAPPMLGPTTRAMLNPLELSAIAPGRSSRPTSSTTNDWRAGISKALITPFAVASDSSHPIVMCLLHVNHQRSVAWMPNAIWPSLTRRSFSVRSATTPAWSEKRSTGNDPADATSPTMNGLFESSNANQPCAIVCIQVPMSDVVWPAQKIRKLRWRWMVWNGLSDGTAALAAGVSAADDAGVGARLAGDEVTLLKIVERWARGVGRQAASVHTAGGAALTSDWASGRSMGSQATYKAHLPISRAMARTDIADR